MAKMAEIPGETQSVMLSAVSEGVVACVSRAVDRSEETQDAQS
jgi:hypothetical protein